MGKYLRHFPRIKQMRGSWLHRRVGDRLLDPHVWQPEREPVARGFAIGGFFSMLPIPFQSLPAVALAIWTRSNVPASLVGCWVTNPVTAPFIWIVQLQIGYFLLGRESPWHLLKDHSVWEVVRQSPWPMAVGTVVTAPISLVVSYFLAGWTYDIGAVIIRRSAERRRAREAARQKTRQ